MTDSPGISVLLPAFNAADTVPAAIRSILGQTFEDFELLVLDDGSSDATIEVADAVDDRRIRVVRLEHRGLAATLNAGIEMAAAPLMARQDADDLSRPDRFELQSRFMEDHPDVDLVASWWNVIDAAGIQVGLKKVPGSSDELERLLFRHNPFAHGSVMFRREAVRSVGAFNPALAFAQDYDLWLRMLDSGKRFGAVQEALYSYTITPESAARGQQKLAFSSALRDRALSGDDTSPLAIGQLPEMSARQVRSVYLYSLGTLAQDDGRTVRATGLFARSVLRDPMNWRAMLKLLLAPLPGSAQVGILSAFRRLTGRRAAHRYSK